MVLYALTKPLIADVAPLVSRAIVKAVDAVLTAFRSSVRPSMASVTWLLGFEIARPSIVNCALTASARCCDCGVPPAADGSNPMAARPLASR